MMFLKVSMELTCYLSYIPNGPHGVSNYCFHTINSEYIASSSLITGYPNKFVSVNLLEICKVILWHSVHLENVDF